MTTLEIAEKLLAQGLSEFVAHHKSMDKPVKYLYVEDNQWRGWRALRLII